MNEKKRRIELTIEKKRVSLGITCYISVSGQAILHLLGHGHDREDGLIEIVPKGTLTGFPGRYVRG